MTGAKPDVSHLPDVTRVHVLCGSYRKIQTILHPGKRMWLHASLSSLHGKEQGSTLWISPY